MASFTDSEIVCIDILDGLFKNGAEMFSVTDIKNGYPNGVSWYDLDGDWFKNLLVHVGEKYNMKLDWIDEQVYCDEGILLPSIYFFVEAAPQIKEPSEEY
jgi:hypothetical protein